MRLYLDNGFIDQRSIYNEAMKNKCSFIIEIGARQVGKTYGTLKFMLDSGNKFILMRRTQTEADFLTNGTVNPFLAIDPDVTIKKDTTYTGIVKRGDDPIGLTVALSTVAKIRGFYGGEYTHMIYDEFIPERHVIKMKYEGEAFLNALVTIGGNREIQGKPPLMTWLLANSNNISSPILQALQVQKKIEQMIAKGQEHSTLSDRGILIILPHSDQIKEQRSADSITKAIGSGSAFSRMAYANEFAYNDNENVKRKPLIEYDAIRTLAGHFSVYQHKDNSSVYITSAKDFGKNYPDTERGIADFVSHYGILKTYYRLGQMHFETLTVKEIFKDVFKL